MQTIGPTRSTRRTPTVIVNGVHKPVRDCTRDEIETVLAGLRENIQNVEEERDSLRDFRKHLNKYPPGTTLTDAGLAE
jgi:hypothetical protein